MKFVTFVFKLIFTSQQAKAVGVTSATVGQCTAVHGPTVADVSAITFCTLGWSTSNLHRRCNTAEANALRITGKNTIHHFFSFKNTLFPNTMNDTKLCSKFNSVTWDGVPLWTNVTSLENY